MQHKLTKDICIRCLLLTALLLNTVCVEAADHVYRNWSYSAGFELTGERLFMATEAFTNTGTMVAAPASKITLRAPRITLTDGFHAREGSNVIIGPPVFYLYFVVVEPKADFPNHSGITSADTPDCIPARNTATTSDFHCYIREDIDLLLEYFNRNFISEDGVQIVKFRYGGFTSFNDLQGQYCERDDNACVPTGDFDSALFKSITSRGIYSYNTVAENFNSCSNDRLCNHNAINVYIYNNIGDNNGHGNNNNHEPHVLIDFYRVTGIDVISGMPIGNARPFLHEFGHAFDLAHVCQEGVTGSALSNLMASPYYCGSLDDIICSCGSPPDSRCETDDVNFSINCLSLSIDDPEGYCDCLLTDTVSSCNKVYSVDEVDDACWVRASDYYPSLVGNDNGNRQDGIAYDSLQDYPDSGQDYWGDAYETSLGCPIPYQDWCDSFEGKENPDINDGEQQLGQMEIIYWNSWMMQYTLTPDYPYF